MRSTFVVLLIVLPPMIVAGVMRTQETPKRFAEVEAGRLYRSAFPTGDQVRHIHKQHGIRTIISLTSDEGKERDAELDNAVKDLGLKRYRFPMNGDGTGELATLDHAADALAQTADQPILFHCSAGDKRTSATLGAYWMKHKGKGLKQTLDELTREYGMKFDGEDRELAKHLSKYAAYIGIKTEPTATQPDEE
ncbi:MAG: dual specificity protein phosphatase family protein [Phycisphaerales bacterium]|nr:dual specificity protein phosphatase family protein [Phycisphaerales bacterium]MCB9856181.1 dual specificity protein phosphatase family protein [Phycisphaerales bacterium]